MYFKPSDSTTVTTFVIPSAACADEVQHKAEINAQIAIVPPDRLIALRARIHILVLSIVPTENIPWINEN